MADIDVNGQAVPAEHYSDAKKLEMDAKVDLFKITLNDEATILYMKRNSTVTWQGNEYYGTGAKISGVGNYADDQVSRPTLDIFNPASVYSSLVDQGLLENGSVARYRVLKEHLDADQNIFQKMIWRISRVASLRDGLISLELRGIADGPRLIMPPRMFIPPDFPAVSLS